MCEPGHELEARVRLGRIGFDNVAGALDAAIDVFQQRPELVERSSRLTVDGLRQRLADGPDLCVIDVRNKGELLAGAIPGARHVPLPQLMSRMADLDRSQPTVVYCAGGARSMIAASALIAAGFADVSDLLGGYNAWSAPTPAP